MIESKSVSAIPGGHDRRMQSGMCDIFGCGCVPAVHNKERLRVYKQQQASEAMQRVCQHV